MPYEARRYSSSGPIIKARDCKITEIHNQFYCKTPGCRAIMSLVNTGNIEEAYFRRKPSSPYHTSADCVRCGIVFDKTKYDETKFVKNEAFDWLFSPPAETHKGTTGTKKGTKGGGKSPVRTLGKLYEMCVSLGKEEEYNGYKIGEFFADAENYIYYSENLEGNIIAECSYFKKAYNEYALLFNYSTNPFVEHILVKVKFGDNTEAFWKYYNKFEGCHHTEPIAIAGNWTKSPGGSESVFECDYKSSRQIYYVR